MPDERATEPSCKCCVGVFAFLTISISFAVIIVQLIISSGCDPSIFKCSRFVPIHVKIQNYDCTYGLTKRNECYDLNGNFVFQDQTSSCLIVDESQPTEDDVANGVDCCGFMKSNYPPNKSLRMFYDKHNLYCVATTDVHNHANMIIGGFVLMLLAGLVFFLTLIDWGKPFWIAAAPQPPAVSVSRGNYEMVDTSRNSNYRRHHFEMDDEGNFIDNFSAVVV